MKIKGLIIITTGMALVSATSIKASAHSFYWWEKTRKVMVTKTTRIYKIKVRYPLYRSYSIKTSTLRPGSIIKTHHMASYDWSIEKNGYAHNARYFWVMNTSSKANWMKPYADILKDWDEKGTTPRMPYQRINSKNHYITKSVGGKKIANLRNYPKTTWYPYQEYIVGEKYHHRLRYVKVHSGNHKIIGWILSNNLKLKKHTTFSNLYGKSNATNKMYNSDGDSNIIIQGTAYDGIRFGNSKTIWLKNKGDSFGNYNKASWDSVTTVQPPVVSTEDEDDD